MNRLPYVALQVEGRSQPGDPGHHCFLQSEGEAGGVSWWVSAPAQPSPAQTPNAGRSLTATPSAPFCLLAGSCLVPLPSPAPFSLPASEAFSPSLFLPSFSPPPFLLPPLLPPPPPLPCPWSGHMGGGGNFLRVCAVGFPRGAVPLITSQGTAPTIPPLMPRLICWGSGSRSSESQSWVEGALTVPFHRQGNRGQNSSPHISRNLLL